MKPIALTLVFLIASSGALADSNKSAECLSLKKEKKAFYIGMFRDYRKASEKLIAWDVAVLEPSFKTLKKRFRTSPETIVADARNEEKTLRERQAKALAAHDPFAESGYEPEAGSRFADASIWVEGPMIKVCGGNHALQPLNYVMAGQSNADGDGLAIDGFIFCYTFDRKSRKVRSDVIYQVYHPWLLDTESDVPARKLRHELNWMLDVLLAEKCGKDSNRYWGDY